MVDIKHMYDLVVLQHQIIYSRTQYMPYNSFLDDAGCYIYFSGDLSSSFSKGLVFLLYSDI